MDIRSVAKGLGTTYLCMYVLLDCYLFYRRHFSSAYYNRCNWWCMFQELP